MIYVYGLLTFCISVGFGCAFAYGVSRAVYIPGDDLSFTLLWYVLAFVLSLFFGFGTFAGIVN